MSDLASATTAIALRVAESRVEDIGHGLARLASSDLRRLGARIGDILKVTGRTPAVVRAELSDPEVPGVIQIDGTTRSNSGSGLEEQVNVALTEAAGAVAIRLTPLWEGAATAIIEPDRILEDVNGVPVIAGAALRVPTFAKAINFQVVRTIPDGVVVIGPRTDIRIVEGEATAVRAP